jgi:hypothetical protein
MCGMAALLPRRERETPTQKILLNTAPVSSGGEQLTRRAKPDRALSGDAATSNGTPLA